LKSGFEREQGRGNLKHRWECFSGRVTGEIAKHLSEKFGKTHQERRIALINSPDTSLWSTQLDYAIPASRTSTLSSGEFVGMVD